MTVQITSHRGAGAHAPAGVTRYDTRSSSREYLWRRLLLLGLNAVTVGLLVWQMARLLASSGWTFAEAGMLLAFAATLPWLSIGFWNAVVGFLVVKLAPNPAVHVTPAWRDAGSSEALRLKTAVAMTIRNEDVAPVLARLETMQRSLDAAGHDRHFAFHVLSDSSRPEICREEEWLVAQWRRRAGKAAGRIHYRRRRRNRGFKAGNLQDFCAAHGEAYDLFIPLDADSDMGAAAVVRLVRCMQAHPEIGILQGLVVGSPSASFFARVFQFGMRHGMRAYTTGSAWWQGDCGPFWGHNAIVRIKPFRDHCRLPELPGRSALSGSILSHDQVEAVLMRRAGYEVRVVAAEDESYEENPPSLLDFIKRDLRWCHGNLQYLRLLGLSGLRPLGRVQLLLAILMYLGPPAWIAFLALGLIQASTTAGLTVEGSQGLALFAAVIAMSLMPKLAGLLDVITSRARRRSYGGLGPLLAGAGTEIVFSMLVAPIASMAVTVFMVRLIAGRKGTWSAQRRDSSGVAWREAATRLWPQTLFGAIMLAVLAVRAPALLPWASVLVVALLGAIPLAVWSAAPPMGRWAERIGLCRIPEETRPSPRRLAAKGDLPLAA